MPAPKKQNKVLTEREELFAREVVSNGGQKVKAYEYAGYSMNMTEKSISVQVEKIYNRPRVNLEVKRLQALKQEVADKAFSIDAKYVLSRIHEIDQLDIIDIIKDDMSGFRPLSEWPKSWRISISSVDMRKIIKHSGDNESIETLIACVKWPDKVKNLKLMGDHVGVKAFQKEAIEVNNITNNVQNNSFDLENLDETDLSVFKQLLLNQAEKEEAIEAEFTQIENKD